MLTLFFLKRFFKNFFLIFFMLILIFSASDLFVRLPLISSMKSIPTLFLLMLPLMSQFAIPLASCLSVQNVIGNLHIEDEVIMFYFFSDARKALYKSLSIFSLFLFFLYTPIVMHWAPISYKEGKKFILRLAKEHFTGLKSNKFHKITPRFSFFFKKQTKIDDQINFDKVLLTFKEKNGQNIFINANSCSIKKDILLLKNGIIQTIENKAYVSKFNETKVNLGSFLNVSSVDTKIKDLKFATFKDLNTLGKDNFPALAEYHKRISQVIWILLFPFLGLFSMMLFARKKSNLLISVFLSGSFFLFSYISLNISKTLSKGHFFLYSQLYLPIFILFFCFGYFYNKKF